MNDGAFVLGLLLGMLGGFYLGWGFNLLISTPSDGAMNGSCYRNSTCDDKLQCVNSHCALVIVK